ncbi:MAG: hypothetical protein JSW39_16050 [Desulfobacterales bacterium]|nr:MAG: hypothetical protein JSW39_16050 [Desulfobacterales bacterium]
MSESESNRAPQCFAHLDTVFPKGPDGLRHTPAKCLACRLKTACLREAITGAEGLKVREERLERAYHSGMIGFWERWSRKKNLERRKNQGKRFRIRHLPFCRRGS